MSDRADPFARRSPGRSLPSRLGRDGAGEAATRGRGMRGGSGGRDRRAPGAAGDGRTAAGAKGDDAGRGGAGRPAPGGTGAGAPVGGRPGDDAGRGGARRPAPGGTGAAPPGGGRPGDDARGPRGRAGRPSRVERAAAPGTGGAGAGQAARRGLGRALGARPAQGRRGSGGEEERDRVEDAARWMRSAGRRVEQAGDLLIRTGVGAKAGVALKGGGRAAVMAAAAVPLFLFAAIVVLVGGVVPSTGLVGPDTPPVDPDPQATAEIPTGYMAAYQAADDQYRVPWPVLAAMGAVLTEHGARSPYDTLRRTDEQRFPVVDPAIAPGAAVGAKASATCRLRVVGDSLLVGMRAGLARRIPACTLAAVDGRVGRTIAEGAAVLRDAPAGDETAVVVVLGTNDLARRVTAADLGPRIDDLLAEAGDRPVVWVTSAARGLATRPTVLTDALTAAARDHPGLVVADWAAHLAGLPGGDGLRAPDGVHYTPAGYGVMADWLARQVAAPGTRAVDAPAGDKGLGPLLLDPTRFGSLGAEGAQVVSRSVDLLAGEMARLADRARTKGAGDARDARFGREFLPESEDLWRSVVAEAPVVAGEGACLQPDPTTPVPRIVELVWRCEMLRTPPTVWTPGGMLTGAAAQDQLLDEAHVVAAAWSSYGAKRCDPGAPFAGVFPVPATALADRCNPVENVRAAARLVLDQESRPLDRRPGNNEWERAAAGWATMPPAFGEGTGNRFASEGPAPVGFRPSPACTSTLGGVLSREAAGDAGTPPWDGLARMAGFAPAAVDFDPARWDADFAGTPLAPLFRARGACDPGTDRAAGFGWLATQLAAHEGHDDPGVAGTAAYATWVAGRGAVPVAGKTGLVPRLHNPRLVAPPITRPPVSAAAPAHPGDFADRVIAKAEVYAGYRTAVAGEAPGWQALAALGIPEWAARAYAKAVTLVPAIEPGCAVDAAFLAGFGFMESGHGTVAVDPATGESDHPPPRAPVRWDPATGDSQPRILGALLDGSGAGGNRTPVPNRLSPADRAFYGQDEPFLRAVGPTQFMPATWETVRAVADGNGDGVADPFNYYDGALATAVKACRDGGGLATAAGQRRAALSYNRSPAYAAGVLAKAAEYRAGLAAQGLGPGAAGSGDAGPGRAVVLGGGPVSIVRVDGIGVNAAIAEPVRAMLAAARADGLELADGAGGWRSQASQVALRRAHCGSSQYAIYQMPASRCSPPTAIPGTSQHERGLAIDFTCNGGSIGQHDHGNPCYLWLSAHAATYGLHNLPSEAWHWSTTGK